MLKINNLSFSFGKNLVLDNVSFELDLGKTYGIVGANGVGKTTLFRILATIYRTPANSVLFRGAPLQQKEVAFLQTDPYFYPYMTGQEYLTIVLGKHPNLEEAIGLASRLNTPLNQLVESYSTGMKKKLAFVACHYQNRPLTIYDEPFNGVDLTSNEVLLHQLRKRDNTSITIIASHILSTLFDCCDEILYIREGFKIQTYSKEEYDQIREQIQADLQID